MTRRPNIVPVLALLCVAPAVAQSPTSAAPPPARICIVPPSVEATVGSADNAIAAVRESFVSILAGPSLTVTPLAARLEGQAREEAKSGNCRFLLFTSVKHTRKSGGLLGHLAAGAVQNGAYAVGSSSSSTVARVATSAAAGAAGAAASAYTYASIVKTRDELALVSRLESGDGKVLLQRTDKRKASSDGEDLVTPVVQHAAEAIADVVTRTTR